MTDPDIEKLRLDLAMQKGRRRRFSAAERARVQKAILALRSSGVTIREVAQRLGISTQTVDRYSQKHRLDSAKKGAPRTLRAVQVKPDAPASKTLRLRSPNGFTVEGLSVSDAAALLKALA